MEASPPAPAEAAASAAAAAAVFNEDEVDGLPSMFAGAKVDVAISEPLKRGDGINRYLCSCCCPQALAPS